MAITRGITGETAPEFQVDAWLDDNDVPRTIADIEAPVIYLYCFQSWCPGCHSHGFPTMAAVKEHYESIGQSDKVEFVAIQTVFEGHETNTPEAALQSVAHHGLTDIALGQDSGHPPATMANYHTGGTPWTVIIGPDRKVIADGFRVNAQQAVDLIDEAISSSDQPAEARL